MAAMRIPAEFADRSPTLTGAVTPVGPLLASGNPLGLMALPHGGFRREAHGCGSVSLDFGGMPLLGDTLTSTVSQTTGAPFIGLGLQVANTPYCTCTIGHDWSALVFSSTSSLLIPNNAQLLGVPFAIQGADILGLGGCPSPQVTLTDTFAFVIG